jgi:hypothetical protein
MNPQMFNPFLDGTKSAIEMAAIANATGDGVDQGTSFGVRLPGFCKKKPANAVATGAAKNTATANADIIALRSFMLQSPTFQEMTGNAVVEVQSNRLARGLKRRPFWPCTVTATRVGLKRAKNGSHLMLLRRRLATAERSYAMEPTVEPQPVEYYRRKAAGRFYTQDATDEFFGVP